MKAIIFAAGRGTRLESGLASPTPKILLEIGGKSLLEWHCQRLVSVGIDEIFVVAGYERNAVDAIVARLREQEQCSLETIYNPDFEQGSVLSFATALPVMTSTEEPVLLMDGDVLYPATMLERLIDSPAATCLLIDRSVDVSDPEPVQVPVRNGRPVDFVKGWEGTAEQVGESIGFFKVDAGELAWLAEETSRLGSLRPAAPYEDILRAMVHNGRFHCEDVTGIPWIEIDFPQDLQRARERVFPAILHHEAMNVWMKNDDPKRNLANLKLQQEELLKFVYEPFQATASTTTTAP